MMRFLALCCLITFGMTDQSLCGDDPWESFAERAFFSDLIVEGRIESTHLDSLKLSQDAPKAMWITEFTVVIERVWAGYFDGDRIVVSVWGGNMPGRGGMVIGDHRADFAVGDQALFLIQYDSFFDRFFSLVGGEFKLMGNRVLFGDSDIPKDASAMHAVIGRAAQMRSFAELLGQADAVVEGRALGSNDRNTEFAVQKSHKGGLLGDTITVTLKRLENTPGEILWIFYGPRGFERDSIYVLFLKKAGKSYYPFAGSNGAFQRTGAYVSCNGRRTPMHWDELERIIPQAE